MPNYDRLTILACLAAVGLGSYLILEPQRWWVLPLAGAVGLGAWLIIREHPALPPDDHLLSPMFAPLSGLLIASAALSLEPILQGGWAVLGAVIAGILLGGTVVAEWYTVALGRYSERARLALNLVTYLVAFGLYDAEGKIGLEGLGALAMVGLVTLLLSVELLRDSAGSSGRAWLYAAVSGVVLTEIRWGLAFWPLTGTLGAIFLVLVFYLVTGVVHSHFSKQLNRGTMAEFAAVALIGLAILFGVRMWAG